MGEPDPKREGLKRWVACWKRAAPGLEAQRERDIAAADTVREMGSFAGLAEQANRELPLREGSGLIEQQRLFLKARAKGRPDSGRCRRT